MVRARICALLGLGLMLASASAESRELEFFVENRIGGDSNVFREPTKILDPGPSRRQNKTEDGFWEVSPRVTLRHKNDDLNYNFRYQPTYQHFFDTSGINGVDHNARAIFDWRINYADSLGFNGDFSDTRRIRSLINDLSTDPDPTPEPSDGERVKRGRGTVYYRRVLTPLLSTRVDYSIDEIDYSKRTISDSRAHSGSARLDYSLDSLTSVGVSVSARFRKSKLNQETLPFGNVSIPVMPAREVVSDTETYDISFSINRALSRTMDISFQIGPTWVVSEQKTSTTFAPNGFPIPGEFTNDDTLSFFAAARLNKRWKSADFGFNYSRFESGTGGTAASSIVDQIGVNMRYRIGHTWTFSAYSSWNRREDVTDDLTVGTDNKTTRWLAIGTIQRKLTGNLTLLGRMQYSNQEQDNTSRRTESEIYSGFISIRYTFDPLVF